jgi:hypothetical protein
MFLSSPDGRDGAPSAQKNARLDVRTDGARNRIKAHRRFRPAVEKQQQR